MNCLLDVYILTKMRPPCVVTSRESRVYLCFENYLISLDSACFCLCISALLRINDDRENLFGRIEDQRVIFVVIFWHCSYIYLT